MLTDKNLACHDCKKKFLFSKGEQEFFEQKGLTNLPKRCPNCRLAAKFARNGQSLDQLYEIECAVCSAPTKVPFKPRQDRPIYCRACLVEAREHKVEMEVESVAV